MNQSEVQQKDLLRYVGDLRQLCGIREYELKSGKAGGLRALDIKNGSGLEFTVLPDRGMDIGSLAFRGVNCSYLSKTGWVVPGYYGSDSPAGFFRGFYAGFLTTCGMRNVGNACEEAGESYGMHGRVSHLPAEEVCAATDWIDGKPVVTVRGKVRESSFFGENMLLERKVTCTYGENRIQIENTIENQGFKPETVMLLLHFNMGYPLLDSAAYFLSSSGKIEPRDAAAAAGAAAYSRMQEPVAGYAEQVFYHDLLTDPEGNTCVALVNPSLELAVSLSFSKEHFFNFAQWKQLGAGEYVLGMEPCNCYVGGRTDPRNKGILTRLQPGEKKRFDVTVGVSSGSAQLKALEDKINQLNRKE